MSAILLLQFVRKGRNFFHGRSKVVRTLGLLGGCCCGLARGGAGFFRSGGYLTGGRSSLAGGGEYRVSPLFDGLVGVS